MKNVLFTIGCLQAELSTCIEISAWNIVTPRTRPTASKARSKDRKCRLLVQLLSQRKMNKFFLSICSIWSVFNDCLTSTSSSTHSIMIFFEKLWKDVMTDVSNIPKLSNASGSHSTGLRTIPGRISSINKPWKDGEKSRSVIVNKVIHICFHYVDSFKCSFVSCLNTSTS